jgi:hypothetical protein
MHYPKIHLPALTTPNRPRPAPKSVRKVATIGGARNLTTPAPHTASDAARANKNSPSIRVDPIRRSVAAALACVPPRENGYPLDSGSAIGQHEGTETRETLSKLVDSGLDRWADWFTSVFQATLNAKTLTCLIHGNDQPEGSVFDLLVARLGSWQIDDHEPENPGIRVRDEAFT